MRQGEYHQPHLKAPLYLITNQPSKVCSALSAQCRELIQSLGRTHIFVQYSANVLSRSTEGRMQWHMIATTDTVCMCVCFGSHSPIRAQASVEGSEGCSSSSRQLLESERAASATIQCGCGDHCQCLLLSQLTRLDCRNGVRRRALGAPSFPSSHFFFYRQLQTTLMLLSVVLAGLLECLPLFAPCAFLSLSCSHSVCAIFLLTATTSLLLGREESSEKECSLCGQTAASLQQQLSPPLP